MELKPVKGDTWVLENWKMQPLYILPGGRCILLDSGMAAEQEAMERTLRSAGLTVAGVLCTHAHIDHAGNNAHFQRQGAQIALPLGEAGLSYSPLLVTAHICEINPALIERDLGSMACIPDVTIGLEADTVTLCGVPFRVIHTPGHSPDHVAYITPDNVCYVGDALLSSRDLEAKLPCSFAPRVDLETKGRLKGLGCDRYVVAHKGIYEQIDTLVDDNLALLRGRLAAVKALLDTPASVDQIIARACTAFGLRGEAIPKAGYYEKNIRNYVYALYDLGELELTFRDGVRCYRAK